MTRKDMIAFERFYAATLRREAKSRAAKYPVVADQFARWAEAADRRVEAIRCGPLFDQDQVTALSDREAA
jgi:hypothetical protein